MSRVSEVREAVAQSLRGLNLLKTVEIVKAGITNAEIKRISVRSPAALVAFMGMNNVEPQSHGEKYSGRMRFGIFLLTAGGNRIEESADLVEAVALHIAGNRFGLEGVRLPTDIDADTLFDDTQEGQGLFMMGLTFQIIVNLDRPAPTSPVARPDDRTTAEALGQGTDARVWPSEISAQVVPGNGE